MADDDNDLPSISTIVSVTLTNFSFCTYDFIVCLRYVDYYHVTSSLRLKHNVRSTNFFIPLMRVFHASPYRVNYTDALRPSCEPSCDYVKRY